MNRMDRDDRFPVWTVLLGVAAGGAIAYAMANPRGKELLRNLPRMLADLTRHSERVLGVLREVTAEVEQSLQRFEASLESVDQALHRDGAATQPAQAYQTSNI